MMGALGLSPLLTVLLVGWACGLQPNSGTCTGNQCFTLFRKPSTFRSAQDICRNRGAHLMTVRSTASHNTLSLLLGNFTGKFWIGLHRPAGCATQNVPLRNFQWVTKDNDSEFLNWLLPSDSMCDSPRCVTVSQEDDFKWAGGPCALTASGFLCEHYISEPCSPLPRIQGDTVIYVTSLGFGGDDLPSLPPGSTATRMPSEITYVCFLKQWRQAPWSCEIHEGGCEYKCAQDPNSVPSCYCPPEYTVNPLNKVTCEEQTVDDPCAALLCEHVCYKEGDTYACACDQGFQLTDDGSSCVDFNDCTDARQCPGENSVCVNTVGGFECKCVDGYKSVADQCVDVDECAQAPCEHMCTNTPGSYTCSCYEGYIEDLEDPTKCVLHCGMKECPAECDPNNRFQCYCPLGYIAEERGDQVFCLDIDECSSFFCDQHCTNTFGGYVCDCSPGFKLVDKYSCLKTEDDDTDTGQEGSGVTSLPTASTSQVVPLPGPTKRPSGVTTGGLVGIIVCTVFFVVLVTFLSYHLVNRRGAKESSNALKVPEGEAHGLHQVSSVG